MWGDDVNNLSDLKRYKVMLRITGRVRYVDVSDATDAALERDRLSSTTYRGI